MRAARIICPFACVSALLAASIAIAQAPPPEGDDGGPPPFEPGFGPDFGPPGGGPDGGGPPGRGPGGMGGPNAPTRKILKDYDKDKNGRLEGAERDAAREFLKKNSERGPGGRGVTQIRPRPPIGGHDCERIAKFPWHAIDCKCRQGL